MLLASEVLPLQRILSTYYVGTQSSDPLRALAEKKDMLHINLERLGLRTTFLSTARIRRGPAQGQGPAWKVPNVFMYRVWHSRPGRKPSDLPTIIRQTFKQPR